MFCFYTKNFVPRDRGDEDDEWEDTDEEDELDSEGGFSGEEDVDGRGLLFMDEETKSRFTDYSLTSSVMRRNEQLSLLDDRFEKVSVGSASWAQESGYFKGFSVVSVL